MTDDYKCTDGGRCGEGGFCDECPHTHQTVERIAMPDTRRTKGEIRKHKKAVGYEHDVPRCGTCIFYNPAWKGDKTIVGSWCKRNKFFCMTNSCCDCWESKSGETLKV